MTIKYRTKDHPEANDRVIVIGDKFYTLTFPLENGDSLEIHCGTETVEKFSEFLGSMILDDMEESYGVIGHE